ncbi:MAG: hypothetical protein ACPGSI_18835 [Pikeienuella sp.]
MALGSILSVGGSLIGGLLGNSAAKKAAETQANIAQNQLGLAVEIHRNTSRKFTPFRVSGDRARQALDYELGLRPNAPVFGRRTPKIEEIPGAPAPQQQVQGISPNTAFHDEAQARRQALAQQNGNALAPQAASQFRVNGQLFNTREEAEAFANENRSEGTRYQGYELSPDYQFLQDQAITGVDSSAASGGTLNSGATLKAVQDRASGIASLGRNDYLNRLTGLSQAGQAAAGNQAASGANFLANANNALSGYGNAVSAGIIGGQNQLTQGINNAIGTFNYQNQLENRGQQNSGIFGGLFSGPAPGSTASFI